MRATKFITVTALFTALLIGVQFALSGVGGVELVTVVFLSFCLCFGVKAGVTVGVSFSLIRCFIFGFYPSVVVLYLVYYTLFGLFFGFSGVKFAGRITPAFYFTVVITATAFTAFFTLLDDLITPLMYGFNLKSMKAYFYASLPFMLTQCICAAVSVAALFVPLVKVFSMAAGKSFEIKFRKSYKNESNS